MSILVTIVTPTYNSEKYLEDCILSIKNQTYNNIEHIIVDGGSDDGTLQIIQKYLGSYNLKYISESDNGMYDAISKGFKIANGEILAWLNSDDLYFPWTIDTIAKIMENKNISWVTGIPGNWTENGVFYINKYRIPIYSRFLIKKGFYHARGLGFIQQESTFWKKSLWEKAGSQIPSHYKLAGDFFLWKNMAKYDTLYTANVFLSGFRNREGQLSSQIDKYYKELGKNSNIFTFILWVLDKVFKISIIIHFFNKKKLLDVSDIISRRKVSISDRLKRIILKRKN